MYKKCNFSLFFLCLFLTVGSSCKTTQRVEKAQLTEKTQTNVLLISPLDISNKVFNKTLNKNEKHAYELDLRENQFVSITVDQDGVDLNLTMISPSKKKFFYDHQLGIKGKENFIFVSESNGKHVLEVGANEDVEPGNYKLELIEIRNSNEVDKIRYNGVKQLSEGKSKIEIEQEEALKTALKDLEEASTNLEQANDFWHLCLAKNYLGNIYIIVGDTNKAEVVYNEAMVLSNKLNDPHLKANILDSFGLVSDLKEETDKTLNYFQTGIDLVEKEEDSLKKAYLLNNLSSVYTKLLETEKAVECLETALTMQQKYGKKSELAINTTNLGNAYLFRGNYPESLKYLSQGVELGKKYSPRAYLYSLIFLSRLYGAIGDTKASMKHLSQAKLAAKELGDRYAETVVLIQTANVHQNNGDLEKAITGYKKALESEEIKTLINNQVKVLNSLGVCYLKTGELVNSEDVLKKALDMSKATKSKYQQAFTLLNLGKLAFTKKENTESLKLLEQSLRFYTELDLVDFQMEANFNIAKVYFEINNLNAAERSLETCLNLSTLSMNEKLIPDFKLFYFSKIKDYYDLYIKLLLRKWANNKSTQYLEKALLLTEQSRFRILSENIIDSYLEKKSLQNGNLGGEKLLQTLSLYTKEKINMLAQGSYNTNKMALLEEKIVSIKRQYQVLESDQKSNYFTLASKFSDLKALINSNTTVLEYFILDEQLWVFIIDDTKLNCIQLGDYQKVNSIIKTFHKSILSNQKVDLNECNKIASIVFNPINYELLKHNLVIIPDGSLSYIPWSTFLVNKHKPVLLPSLSVLKLQRDLHKDLTISNQVVVVGDPIFDENDERVKVSNLVVKNMENSLKDEQIELSSQSLNLREITEKNTARLTFTNEESKAIQKLFPNAKLLLGFEAIEKNLNKLKNSKLLILHLATHTVINTNDPELSFIMLSAIAENGERINSYLTLQDVYNLNLSADLVVLSSCQSGLGRQFKGEGLLGFGHAFLSTGTSKLITTLWDVDDQFTSIFMKKFYENLNSDPKNAVDALQKTQQSFITDPKWSNPFYWAAFNIQGD